MVDFSGSKSPIRIARRKLAHVHQSKAGAFLGLRQISGGEPQPVVAVASVISVDVDDLQEIASSPVEIKIRSNPETDSTRKLAAVRIPHPRAFPAIFEFEHATLRGIGAIGHRRTSWLRHDFRVETGILLRPPECGQLA